jgi:acyl-coenzyme A synthetase/AMP-(fatty) acid ligase
LKLTGRIKELINRGGEKISPLEVDSALLSVQGVKEAVCFGVEDKKYGEVVWAGMVLEGGRDGSKQDESKIKAALTGKLSKVRLVYTITLIDSDARFNVFSLRYQSGKHVYIFSPILY